MLRAALVFASFALLAGCRVRATPNPTDPEEGAACPAGLVLAMAVDGRAYEAPSAIVRFTPELVQCRGVNLGGTTAPTVTAIAGLPSGGEVVGFEGGYGRNGSLARFEADREVARVLDPERHPKSIAAITFGGQPALAVLWSGGDPFGSLSNGLIAVHAQNTLQVIDSWPTRSSYLWAVAEPIGEPGMRLSGVANGDGVLDYRADPGADSLATTNETRALSPVNLEFRALDVQDGVVRATAKTGVLRWERGGGAALLGPVECRWPYRIGGLLPDEQGSFGDGYVAGVIDPRDPERTIVIYDGRLTDGSSGPHLFVHYPRGECEHIASLDDDFAAVGLSWIGRP